MNASAIRALWLSGRSMVRRPLAPLVCIGTLGLGIGATLLVFALANGLFLRPLPGVAEPERLVRIQQSGAASWPNYRDLAAGSQGTIAMAAFSDHLVEVEVAGRPRQALGLLASEEYFEVLGVRPALGRLSLDGPGIVVSHRLWRQELGESADAPGLEIRVHRVGLPIVGVAPEGFIGTFRGFQVDLWIPADLAPLVAPAVPRDDRDLDRLEAVGRLAPGSSRARAAEAVEAMAAALRRDHPDVNREYQAAVEPLTGWDEDLRRPLLGLVTLLSVLAILVLLVAVANVTGLLLARLDQRRREMALHEALGAPPGTLVALGIGEPLVLAAGGAIVGLGLAGLGSRLWLLFGPSLPIPVALDLGVDHRVAAASIACATVAAVLTGLPGVLRAWGADPGESLKGRSPGVTGSRSRGRSLLVIGQVAASAALLMIAALCVRALENAGTADLGLTVDGVAAATLVDLTPMGLESAAATARMEASLDRLRQDPAIAGAGATTSLPLLSAARAPIRPFGAEGVTVPAVTASVDPGYLDTVGIPVIDGRGIRAEDDASRPRMAVIDETLAGRLWPGDEAVGRRLRIGDDSAEVVGVARAVRRPGGRPVAPTVYLPLAQHPTRRVHLVARSNDGIAAGERLEEAVRALLPGGIPPAITPLAEVLQVVLLPQRVAAAVAGALGLLALLLAAVGLHALMALLVRRRRRELAVRLALGAMPSGLFREVARRGLGLSLIGLTAGLFLGGAAGGTLRGFLVGVGPADPGALVVPLLAVGTAALLAVWLPARRASRIDPMAALREE